MTTTTDRLEQRRALWRLVFENTPDGIAIAKPDGSMELNAAGEAIVGSVPQPGTMDRWAEDYGLFHPDKTTRYATDALAIVEVLRTGKPVVDQLIFMRNAAKPDGAWLSVHAYPLPDGSAIGVFRDVTRDAAVRERLETRRAALIAAERENRELIERLRVALDELSTPILELWRDVLVLPVIGVVDTQRSAQMTERLLGEVASRRARRVIVDLTGVEVVDTATADRLVALARSVRLLGAECLITGIRPSVAQTMVTMGVDLGRIVTLRNLAHALEWCMRRERGPARRSQTRAAAAPASRETQA
jgi:rsbT co-antagonist protein RsbR